MLDLLAQADVATPWGAIAGIFIAIVGAISGGFGVLWKFVSKRFAEQDERLTKCQEEHNASAEREKETHGRLCHLEGKHELTETLIEDVKATREKVEAWEA